MISIIISSYNQDLFQQFSNNVAATIGVPYEIIQIWNPNEMGICEAYNKGGEKAKYPYLVFCHEDIWIHTRNWGELLIRTFEKNPDIGLIGSLGGQYKTIVDSGWSSLPSYTRSFFVSTHYGKSWLSVQNSFDKQSISLDTESKNIPLKYLSSDIMHEEVAMIDGFFMATKSDIHRNVKFDMQTFDDFHFYDIDYSLTIEKKWKVVVTYNILVEHFSSGSINKNWLIAAQKFYKKWRPLLPLHLSSLQPISDLALEADAFVKLERYYRRNKYFSLHLLSQLMNFDIIKKYGIQGFCKYVLLICKLKLNS